MNGQPAQVAMTDSKLYRPESVGDHRTYAEDSPVLWMWFNFDLPPGRSEVAVPIQCPQGDPPGMNAVASWSL